IQELSKITGIHISDFKVGVKTTISLAGDYCMKELLDSMKVEGSYNNRIQYLSLKISSTNEDKFFSIDIDLPLDFNKLQADGRSLLYHSSVYNHEDSLNKHFFSTIVVNKGIEDIIFDFPNEFFEEAKVSVSDSKKDLAKAVKLVYMKQEKNNENKSTL
ncbi:MAG: hypothetical protein IJX26_00690, partial [Clostridia bacterium]|nr:hypothetical protein [Clostridia bacterium]